MSTARAHTRQRRAKIERKRFPTQEEIYDALPLNVRVAHEICGSFYNDCACQRSIDKPVCQRLEGAARHVIDIVRRHDLKVAGK
jgi:hypothetical protein